MGEVREVREGEGDGDGEGRIIKDDEEGIIKDDEEGEGIREKTDAKGSVEGLSRKGDGDVRVGETRGEGEDAIASVTVEWFCMSSFKSPEALVCACCTRH